MKRLYGDIRCPECGQKLVRSSRTFYACYWCRAPLIQRSEYRQRVQAWLKTLPVAKALHNREEAGRSEVELRGRRYRFVHYTKPAPHFGKARRGNVIARVAHGRRTLVRELAPVS